MPPDASLPSTSPSAPATQDLLVSLWNPQALPDPRGQRWQLAGVLRTQGPCRGAFSYLRAYDGPPLDPLHLDYRAKPPGALFAPQPGQELFGVFRDILPGYFGSVLWERCRPALQGAGPLAHLAAFGTRSQSGLLVRALAAVATPERLPRSLAALETIAARIEGLLAGDDILDEAHVYALTTLGGARPKAAVCLDGIHYVAKFNRPDDVYTSLARVEHAMLRWAAASGLSVPESRVVTLPRSGADVLLVARYDRQGAHRAHRLSLRTLTGTDNIGRWDTHADARDVTRILQALAAPETDHDEWIRRIAFMAAMHDSDNHFGNVEMRLDEENRWRLAPAYDLVPVTGNPAFATRLCGFVNPYQAVSVHLAPAIARFCMRPLAHVQALVYATWTAMVQQADTTFREARIGSVDAKRLYEGLSLARVAALTSQFPAA